MSSTFLERLVNGPALKPSKGAKRHVSEIRRRKSKVDSVVSEVISTDRAQSEQGRIAANAQESQSAFNRTCSHVNRLSDARHHSRTSAAEQVCL